MSTIYFQELTVFGSETDKASFFRQFKEMLVEVISQDSESINFLSTRDDAAEAVNELSKKYPDVWAFLSVSPEHDMSQWEIVYHGGARVSWKYVTMYHHDYKAALSRLWASNYKLVESEISGGNNCCQIMTITGQESTVRRIINLVSNDINEEGLQYLDFGKIIPLPDGMDVNSEKGREWCLKNWGTECNAFNQSKTEWNKLKFTTTGHLPLTVLEKLSQMHPDTDFNLEYIYDQNSITGEYQFRNGVTLLNIEEDINYASLLNTLRKSFYHKVSEPDMTNLTGQEDKLGEGSDPIDNKPDRKVEGESKVDKTIAVPNIIDDQLINKILASIENTLDEVLKGNEEEMENKALDFLLEMDLDTGDSISQSKLDPVFGDTKEFYSSEFYKVNKAILKSIAFKIFRVEQEVYCHTTDRLFFLLNKAVRQFNIGQKTAHQNNSKGKNALSDAGKLMDALDSRDLLTAKQLVVVVDSVNYKGFRKKTLLMTAAQLGYTDIVRTLIDKGAKTDTKELAGWTALMMASYAGHKEVVKILIEKGAKINLKNSFGHTALMLASSSGKKEVVRLLLDEGARINLKSRDGRTALMMASDCGHAEVLKLLLDEGASLGLKSDEGKNVYDYAKHLSVKSILGIQVQKTMQSEIENEKLNGAKCLKILKKLKRDSRHKIDTNNETISEIIEFVDDRGGRYFGEIITDNEHVDQLLDLDGEGDQYFQDVFRFKNGETEFLKIVRLMERVIATDDECGDIFVDFLEIVDEKGKRYVVELVDEEMVKANNLLSWFDKQEGDIYYI